VLFSVFPVLPEAIDIDYFSAIRKEDELIQKTLLLPEQRDHFVFDFLQELSGGFQFEGERHLASVHRTLFL
jgi:hypothetical protein